MNKFLLAKTLAKEIVMSTSIDEIDKDITYKDNECAKEIQKSAKKFIIFLEENASNIFLDFMRCYFNNIKSYSLSPTTINTVDDFIQKLKDDEEAKKIEKETGYKNQFREPIL